MMLKDGRDGAFWLIGLVVGVDVVIYSPLWEA